MTDHELVAAVEQIEQAGLAVRALEHVLLVDPDHGQFAPLGVERVACPGHRLLLGQQLLAGNQPLIAGHDLRKTHRASPVGWVRARLLMG